MRSIPAFPLLRGGFVLVSAFGLFFTSLAAKDAGLPPQKKALQTLASAGFKEEPVQIPATVIDTGILKFVPYLSFRVGEDRELNIYGDPAAPACIEIGLYRGLIASDVEKLRCIAYLRRLLPDVDFMALKLTGGKALRGGLVLEITPPDAPDAYGGWWISAYSLPLLRGSAATNVSVTEISVPRDQAAPSAEWTASEIDRARPSSTGSSGRVYVRSYTRKDGTFVRAHTRKR